MSYGMQTAAGSALSGNAAGQTQQMKEKIPSGYRKGSIQQFSPEQMQLFQQLFSHLGPNSFLSRLAGGDESFFKEMEQPAWRQFQESQGQLGSRFSQLAPGAMSAQRGSGFQNAAGQQASDFAMNLASQRRELQRQAILDLMGLSGSLLGQRPYENFLTEKRQKQGSGWGSLLGAGLGGAAGSFFGMPVQGAALGAGIGSQF